MKIVIISDTHTQEEKVKLPEGDILIHAGDYDIRNLEQLEKLNSWFGKQNFKHKICIAGNHDFYLESLPDESAETILTNVHYLENSSVTIEGIKFWGSPYTPIFHDWAFMMESEMLRENWEEIPNDSDIVITHGPAYGINDQLRKANGDLGMNVGCPYLRERLKEVKPKYHICGHIHEAYGIYKDANTVYINASLLDEMYHMGNEPIVIDYENDMQKEEK